MEKEKKKVKRKNTSEVNKVNTVTSVKKDFSKEPVEKKENKKVENNNTKTDNIKAENTKEKEEFGLGFVYDFDEKKDHEDNDDDFDYGPVINKRLDEDMEFASLEDNISSDGDDDYDYVLPNNNVDKEIDKTNNKTTRTTKRKKKKKSKWRGFWIGLSIYAAVLLVLFIIFMVYTNNSLSKYENSQSVYAMQKYFDKFSASVSSGTLPGDVVLPDGVTKEEYLSYINGKKLSFEKAAGNYSSEKPIYSIKANGEEILRVSYEGYNEKVIFAILTVLDWKIVDVKAIYKNTKETESTSEIKETETEAPTTEVETTTEEETTTEAPTCTYTIKVPAIFTVYIDGEEVSMDYVTKREEIDNLYYANKYLMTSDMVTYTVPKVLEGAKVTMKDQHGNDVTDIEKKKNNTYVADFSSSDEVPEAYKDVALTIAENWSLFMTRDLTGEAYGFNYIAQYLINGSDYYNRAYAWATGVDITFTSPHTLGDPIFTNVVVDEFTSYSDTCFSCHISFSKDMYLTVTGTVANDNTDATFVFLFYDDSDDGVDNGRWTLVDMISR